jgi:hypothetical protein
VNTASNTVVGRLGGFSQPIGISLVANAHTLYVLNVAPSPGAVIGGGSSRRDAVEDNALVPVDLNDDVVQALVPIPAEPRSFGISP